MRTRLGFLRHQYALLTLAAAVFAIAIGGLAPSPAYAQGNTTMPDRAYSAGPFQLHDGDRVLIGMLLPAVQRVREAASFSLLDSSGMRLWGVTPGPPNTNPNASFFSSFFDITYRAGSDTNPNGGRFEILAKGVPGGGYNVPSADGILIGLLVPAVRPNGKTASPLATSMQSFNASGGTMTHSFFDVFLEPGPSQ